jgi:hypothetical protein
LHDAFLNAAMLLGGIIPTERHPTTAGGKIFAGLYALYAGLFFGDNECAIRARFAPTASPFPLGRIKLQCSPAENKAAE